MHNHDTDLIMALAEGTLDPEQATAAEAEIAACPSCTEDLGLQRAALEALEAAPPAVMNDLERARLHRAVRDGLGVTPAEAAGTAPSRDARRFRVLTALAGAAAVFIAVIAISPGLGLLGAGDGDGAATTTASAGGDIAAAETAPRELSRFENDMADGGATVDDTAESSDELSASATTAAPAPTTTAPPADTASPGGAPIIVWSDVEYEAIPDLEVLAFRLAETGSLVEVFGEADEEAETRVFEVLDLEECQRTARAFVPDATEAYVVGVSGVDDVEVVLIAYITGDFDSVTILIHELETCKVVTAP